MTAPFVNWARTVRRQPARWAQPATSEEVAGELRRAADAQQPVRVVGSRHSWSDVATLDGALHLDLRRLRRLVRVGDDRVTVQAAMTLGELVDALALRGRALPVLGSVTAQTVAGAIGTGTHGASLQEGCLSDQVLGMQIVDAAGGLHTFAEDDPALDGARLHLGRLGVVTQVTLRTVPAFALRERRVRIPLDGAVGALLDACETSPFAKLWWLPGRPHAVLFTHDRAASYPLPPGQQKLPIWQSVVDRAANGAVFPALLAVGARWPAAVPAINGLVDAVHLAPGTRTGPMQHLLPLAMPPRHRETEWAVPLGRGQDAWRAIQALMRDRPLDFIVELRPVPTSPAWLAPSHDQPRLHLGVYAARVPWADSVFGEATAALRSLGGLPHWGKEGAADAGALAWPGAAKFRALVARLDPDGRFAHPSVDAAIEA